MRCLVGSAGDPLHGENQGAQRDDHDHRREARHPLDDVVVGGSLRPGPLVTEGADGHVDEVRLDLAQRRNDQLAGDLAEVVHSLLPLVLATSPRIGLLEAAFITSVGALTGLVGITPAGLGVAEGLVVLAASSIGLPVYAAFAAAMLQRVVVFLLVGVLSPYTSAVLARGGRARLSGGEVTG